MPRGYGIDTFMEVAMTKTSRPETKFGAVMYGHRAVSRHAVEALATTECPHKTGLSVVYLYAGRNSSSVKEGGDRI
jgi:hypothetical protein